MRTALEYFGGKDVVFQTVIKRLVEARISCGMVQEELGELALSNPGNVAELESGQKPQGFSASDVLALATQLGLSIDRLLPFHSTPTGEERGEWEKQIAKAEAGFVTAADEHAAREQEAGLSVDLFVRIQALQELFPTPEASSRKQQQVALA